MKRYRGVLIFLAVALLALSGAVWYYDHTLGYVCLGTAVFILVTVLLCLISISRNQQRLMDAVFADNRTAASELIRKVSIPALILDLTGKIVWHNDALGAVFEGKNVLEVLPDFNPSQPTVQQILLAGTNFQVMTMPVHRLNTKKKLLFQYARSIQFGFGNHLIAFYLQNNQRTIGKQFGQRHRSNSAFHFCACLCLRSRELSQNLTKSTCRRMQIVICPGMLLLLPIVQAAGGSNGIDTHKVLLSYAQVSRPSQPSMM